MATCAMHARHRFFRRPTTRVSSSKVPAKTCWKLEGSGRLDARLDKRPDGTQVAMVSWKDGQEAGDGESITLHWAWDEWKKPLEGFWPNGTLPFDEHAVRTPLSRDGKELEIPLPAEEGPHQLVMLLVDETQGIWIKDNGKDFVLRVKPASAEGLLQRIVKPEATYSNWGLFNRFCLAIELLDQAAEVGGKGMASIYTWIRFSANKQLDWYRNSNYQSKDIAHVQKTLTEEIARVAVHDGDADVRRLARMTLGLLPRGGGDSEQIRMGILNIMRTHGIKEGHRPGIEENFLEEWHQKLHTNTSPEDIAICEAYLACQFSGNPGDFYRVIWENHGISKEYLENMYHPIRHAPIHLPHMIPDFQHFLWILKLTHSGADLDVSLENAKGYLDGELNYMLHDLLEHRTEWWVPGKIVEIRKRLSGYWKHGFASRDVLLLDVALEDYFRLQLQKLDYSNLSIDDALNLIPLILENALVTEEDQELMMRLSHWSKLLSVERWTGTMPLQLLAASETLALTLAHHMDKLLKLVSPCAEAIGEACNVDRSYITNFAEESVRGQPLFVLSSVLRHVEPQLREAGGVGKWHIISQTQKQVGQVQVVSSLASVQGQTFSRPTILLSDKIDGSEDIPENIRCIIATSDVDILSHLAIRARNQQVTLACCSDLDAFSQLKELEGMRASAEPLGDGEVQLLASDEADQPDLEAPSGDQPTAMLRVPPLPPKDKLVVLESEFQGIETMSSSSGVCVGPKASNLHKLKQAIGPDLHLPSSAALVLGAFERILEEPDNDSLCATLQELSSLVVQESLDESGVPVGLETIRQNVVEKLSFPDTLRSGLKSTLLELLNGTESPPAFGDMELEEVVSCVLRVWASKWTDRAWLYRQARGIPDEDLRMGCLIQPVIRADYAFVLHTANPITKDTDEMFGEVVCGMGEALVGNYPGRALSFVGRSTNGSTSIHIKTLPSKRTGLFIDSDTALMVRSDSNGEDLEEFAGAGLYDSYPTVPAKEATIDYAHDPLVESDQFREQLLEKIFAVGKKTEAAMGGVPQDIEGVVKDGDVHVVQTRPQIL